MMRGCAALTFPRAPRGSADNVSDAAAKEGVAMHPSASEAELDAVSLVPKVVKAVASLSARSI
eukprot:8224683-Pyramimonas_sp.AAC.1